MVLLAEALHMFYIEVSPTLGQDPAPVILSASNAYGVYT